MRQDQERAFIELIVREPHRIGWMFGKTKLGPLHSEWCKYIWHPTESRCLQAHRGSYKSTGIVEPGVLWWLLFHPDARIAVVRKTKTDAEQCISVFRNAFKVPEVRELFRIAQGAYPEFKVERSDSVSMSFKDSLTREGNIDGYGIDSAITGKHYDIIICDDIITNADRYSVAKRNATIRFLEELRTNIVDPGKPVHHIGTPWHKDDAWGYPKAEGGEWSGPKPIVYDCYSTGILTPEQIEHKRKTTTPSLFAANYLLKHQADENALFAHPTMSPIWEYGIHSPVHAHIDAAFGGDHTSALSIIQELPDGTIQVFGMVMKDHIAKHYGDIMLMFKRYRVDVFHMEENADKGFTGRDMARIAREAGMRIEYKPYHEYQNKGMKISTVLKWHFDNLRFIDPTESEYMGQITEWMEGQEPDDACFVAGTLIATPNGLKPIEEIKEGELIVTPFGKGLVTFSGITGTCEVVENAGLVGTPDHKVFSTKRHGFFRLDSFSDNETSNFNLSELLKWQIAFASYTLETGIAEPSRDAIISMSTRSMKKGKADCKNTHNCILQYGKILMEQRPLKATTSIMWTLTMITMTLQIWFAYQAGNTRDCIKRAMRGILSMLLSVPRNWIATEARRPHGMAPRKVEHGIWATLKTRSQKHGNEDLQEPVNVVEKNSSLQKQMRDFAQIFVEGALVTMHSVCTITHVSCVARFSRTKWKPGANIAQINAKENTQTSQCSPAHAKCAEQPLQIHLRSKYSVERIVQMPQKGPQESVPVYGLTIKGAGCYYANGVLVSNCDSLASILRQALGANSANEELYQLIMRAHA